jgi:putative aminopeptidase FrvX
MTLKEGNDMQSLAEILMTLSAAFGPSGNEEEVRRIFKNYAGHCQWRQQRFGNLYAELPGNGGGPRVMLAAHMDEVGIMVQSLTNQGWARFVTLGSWPAMALPAQRFRFHTRGGDTYYGITGVLPPHFLRDEDRNRVLKPEELHLDFGALNQDDLNKLGIAVGDVGVPDVEPKLLPTGIVMGKAMDDRVGCSVLLQVCTELFYHSNTLLMVGTVQEEVGLRGMRVAGRELRPDIAIILEGAPTDERLGATPQTVMGKGPQIRFYDPSLIAHRGLVRWLLETAEQSGIPFQTAVRISGGTDGGAVQFEGEGVPTAVIGIPVRYAHSHQGVVSLHDLEHTVDLIRTIVSRLDDAAFQSILEYNA